MDLGNYRWTGFPYRLGYNAIMATKYVTAIVLSALVGLSAGLYSINRTQLLNTQAFKALENGNYDLASRLTQESLIQNTNNVDAYCNRGYISATFNRHPDAIADFSKALTLDPSNSWAFRARGVSRDAVGDRAGALDDFSKAIEIEPSNSDNYLNRANVYTKDGKFRDALQDWNKLATMEPNCFYAHYQVSLIKLHLGDESGALTSFKEALRINPSYQPAKNFLAADHLNASGISAN